MRPDGISPDDERLGLMAECFLSGEDFTFFADVVSNWLAYGIGLGAVFWLVGQIVRVIYQFLRY